MPSAVRQARVGSGPFVVDQLRCEFVGQELEFVREQDDPLAAVEVDREELTAEVLPP
jgi:hypothetical protein